MLIRNSFGRESDATAGVVKSVEEIFVFPTRFSQFGAELQLKLFRKLPAENHVPGISRLDSTVVPYWTSRMKVPSTEPWRNSIGIYGDYRSQNRIPASALDLFEQRCEPVRRRGFVVVEKSDPSASGCIETGISCDRYVVCRSVHVMQLELELARRTEN
jgi:hypothetical protein